MQWYVVLIVVYLYEFFPAALLLFLLILPFGSLIDVDQNMPIADIASCNKTCVKLFKNARYKCIICRLWCI